MTLPDALAWADATENERWAMLPKPDPSEPLTYDAGAAYHRAHAAALTTLAEVVREREGRVCGTCQHLWDLNGSRGCEAWAIVNDVSAVLIPVPVISCGAWSPRTEGTAAKETR